MEEEAEGEEWDWISPLDELQQSMERGSVFSGFDEGAIAFPPTFKFHTEGPDPGCYNQVGVFYRTTIGGFMQNIKVVIILLCLYMYGYQVPELKGAYKTAKDKEGSDLRTPSYTDRILIHSLPGIDTVRTVF